MSIPDIDGPPHDPELLDRLAALQPHPFDGIVWRATRLNQDPAAFSYNGGRWAPPSSYQSVGILYTSLERDGAIAEMTSWLSLLVPRPTKPIQIHQLKVTASDVIQLNATLLAELSVDNATYGERNYAAMGEAPPSRTQAIGAALSFLGMDGLIVPSARFACDNLILFETPDNRLEIVELGSEVIEWS